MDEERARLQAAVDAQPADLEAHVSLLRHLHKARDRAAYETAAQAMCLQVRSTLDPSWREAVVMGVALSPGNPLFSQAGWNAPRFGDTGVMPSGQAPANPPPAAPADAAPGAAADDLEGMDELAAAAASPAQAHDVADEDWDSLAAAGTEPAAGESVAADPEPGFVASGEPDEEQAGAPDEAAFEFTGTEAGADEDGFAAAGDEADEDAMRSADEDASATKIELAKAYLEIGDVDGARGMLEEVVAEAGPEARAEAERLLREIG